LGRRTNIQGFIPQPQLLHFITLSKSVLTRHYTKRHLKGYYFSMKHLVRYSLYISSPYDTTTYGTSLHLYVPIYFIPEVLIKTHCHEKFVCYVPEFIDCANFKSLFSSKTKIFLKRNSRIFAEFCLIFYDFNARGKRFTTCSKILLQELHCVFKIAGNLKYSTMKQALIYSVLYKNRKNGQTVNT
jgi:hypothetical protein